MALVTIPGPGFAVPFNGYSTASYSTIDADADIAAYVFRCPAAGTLTQVAFGVGAVVGTHDAFSVKLYTVDGDGLPTTTYIDNPTNAAYGTVNIAGTDDNSMIVCNINGGTGVTVTKNQIMAMRMEWDDGDGDYVRINGMSPNMFTYAGFPYMLDDLSAGSWTKRQFVPCVAVNIGGWLAPPGCLALSQHNTDSVDKPSDPEERGVIVNLPFPCTASGAVVYCTGAAANSFYVKLYSDPLGTPTEIATTALIDTDQSQIATSGRNWVLSFTAPVDLAANTAYALVVSPNVNGTNVSVYYYMAVVNTVKAAYPLGANNIYCSRDDTGAFTTDDTRIGCQSLILSRLDDGGPTNAAIAQATWEYANRELTA